MVSTSNNISSPKLLYKLHQNNKNFMASFNKQDTQNYNNYVLFLLLRILACIIEFFLYCTSYFSTIYSINTM